jgi:hypothetical protein
MAIRLGGPRRRGRTVLLETAKSGCGPAWLAVMVSARSAKAKAALVEILEKK